MPSSDMPSLLTTEEEVPVLVVRSSRGRAQFLPKKFKDSVLIELLKKQKTKIKDFDDEFKCELSNSSDFCYKDGNFDNLESSRDKDCYRACKNLKSKKYFNSEHSNENVEKVKRKKDEYFSHEFVSGDIVWAKPGIKFPSWPAMVVDHMKNTSVMVVDMCVPGTVCIKFFGHHQDGNERVEYDFQFNKQDMAAYVQMVVLSEGSSSSSNDPWSNRCTVCLLLPMGTPSNIVGFTSGHIEIKDIIKTGLPLKVAGIAVLSVLMPTLDQMYSFTFDKVFDHKA